MSDVTATMSNPMNELLLTAVDDITLVPDTILFPGFQSIFDAERFE